MVEPLRILGIDPGSRKTGFGVVEWEASCRRVSHIAHGVLYLDVETSLPFRARELAERLSEIVKLYAPHQTVLEEIFISNNPRSALILGQARGVVLAVLGLHELPVLSLATTRVKNMLTGTGRASKNQVGQMVKQVLALDKKPAEDAADALALAICGGYGEAEKSPLLFSSPKQSTKQRRHALMEIARSQGKI